MKIHIVQPKYDNDQIFHNYKAIRGHNHPITNNFCWDLFLISGKNGPIRCIKCNKDKESWYYKSTEGLF